MCLFTSWESTRDLIRGCDWDGYSCVFVLGRLGTELIGGNSDGTRDFVSCVCCYKSIEGKLTGFPGALTVNALVSCSKSHGVDTFV